MSFGKKKIIFNACNIMNREELDAFQKGKLLGKKFVLRSGGISPLEKDKYKVTIEIEMEW